ncbi:MAG: C25 family cysteine peptidase [Candidatus Sulfotelmatobacter sp.]
MVSDSGTPPDPNTGNNTYVSVATVQAATCATVSQATTGNNLTGILNTYYPGTANVAAGATKIPVGTATGAGAAIAAGNLLLVIQMQDASINDANTVAYGNGYTGQGFTALNSAGDYEFVTATGPVAAGSVPIAGAGAGGGLVFAYHHAVASATAGQSTYQVIVVPQYTTASFNPTTPPTALAWNGSTGGVLALDASGTLTLNGATVVVDGLGFRGGAGMELTGGGGANTDYRQPAPTAGYAGVAEAGWDAPKGEGIAGTPSWVESGGTYLATGTSYPSGTAGTDGSMARGAPANAGAGGTDGDPQTASPGGNDQNAGGGGGANGGGGGFGGDSWSTNLSVGGEGGAAFPATINRVAMGGGGGAGTRNNSDGDNQASGGASGGGIIILRTNALSGTGTFTANGTAAYKGTANDAGGGGGAGGTIVILSANGGESGLTLQANGGNGGDAWASEPFTLGNRHGPGGGGGGGVVLVSGTPASLSITGGTSGITENPGVTYGATNGATGVSVTNATISSTSGTQSGAQCTPDVTLTKSHVGNFTRGSIASYTIPVSNLSLYGATKGTVTVNDTLPVGLTPTSAIGTGWTCSIALQTVSCIDATALAANSGYPAITISANVAQTAPSTVSNTATVGGGGEINLANDNYTDVANVVSTADLSVSNVGAPNPVSAGSNITYTQIVTNSGPSAADNATVAEAVPANTTFVSVSAPAGWSCTTPTIGGTGNVVCTTLNMAGSTAATFSMVVNVTLGTTSGTVITDKVTASSSTSDPNSTNNSAFASTVVGTTAGAELTVTNAVSPIPVESGNDITYTQVVTNTGSGATTGTATFTEATPANTTFVSITPAAGWTCTGFPPLCTDTNPVLAGATGTFTVVYKVTGGTAITDTVTVNAGNQAFGASSATVTDPVFAAGQADLALSTVATPLTVIAGNNITYTQVVTNSGPAAASTVSFSETIPTNTTFVSVSAPAGWSCTTAASVTCNDSSQASGASADIIVVVNVAPTVTTTPITAASSVSATNATTVQTSVNTALVDKCDLTVTNSGIPNPVTAGSDITYTQTVYNHGPSDCSAASFTEATPANTTFVSVSAVTSGGGTWTCPDAAPVACTNASVAPGSTATITAVYQVAAGTAAGTIITDTATASSSTPDTNFSDNSATVTIGVATAGQADLSVTNSASPNPVTAGQKITYSQTVSNGGPGSASTITLTETLPANTTFVSLTGPAGWTCTTAVPYTCTIASLAANATANFIFVVQTNTTVASGSTVADTVSVASATSDPNSGNNTASANVQVANSADLSVTDSPSPVPVQANANITYTQVVSNAGPSAATSASLTESTPPNTTFQSVSIPAGWSCTTPAVGATGAITCTDPSFAAGSASFTVVVKVNAGTAAGTAITNTATVSSSTTDPNAANNSATAADVVATATQADLIATNSAALNSVAAGSNATYTQSVTNNGPAAATGVTFTQTTPPNTNFQSITAPAGWTCVTPAVGATGTITCTDGGNLALNAAASFTLVLQVSASTPSGTNIPDTVMANAGNIVPSLTSNSATATVVVANANSAAMAIVKTATPSPTVAEGDDLTYSLAITNNGPASATNVTVTDGLPSEVTYLSATSTTGTCSEAGGTVTCLLGTMADAATATVTIITVAGAPGVVSNTATVSADQTGSSSSSTQTETITAPTKIQLQAFAARTGTDKTGATRVVLLWKTGREAHDLGFNVYREQNGERVQLNPSLIAGSALLMSGALPKHSGKTYAWIDSSPGSGSGAYWLEDVDVNGTRMLHGPVTAEAASSQPGTEAVPATSLLLNQLNQAVPAAASNRGSHPVESALQELDATPVQRQKQFELAANPAVKIFVKHEGWHRVTQPELVQAGLNPNVDPALLHLYAEAVEQPIRITGASAGPGGFGPQAALQFYGTGIDTQYSGTRVYWLATGDGPGQRIQRLQASTGSNQPPASFPFTVEFTPHTTYFAALITSNGNNFFGPLVSSTPVEQTMQAPHLSTDPAKLEIILQGVILGVPHEVTIALNGSALGDLTFTGQDKGTFTVNLPPGLLQNGNNTVTLTAQGGEYDTSLVQSIRITYPHSYIADSDDLKFTGRPGDELKVTGFASAPVVVLDITDPDLPVELTPQITASSNASRYALQVQVPWTTSNPASPARHTLLAVAAKRVLSAAAIRQNHPSHWHRAQPGSEIVVVSYEPFAAALDPLLRAHKAQGKSTAVVSVDDLYDEFSFGEHSPHAIRDFLYTATKVWSTAPRYLLLNGRASIDPRNYLGFGHLDFVPTKIVPTTNLMTASDDWLSDFTDSGMPTIATGRFPVSTAEEAKLVAGKVATYEGKSTDGAWTSRALMVADANDTENFSQDSKSVQANLPASMRVTDVFASTMETTTVQQDILTAINSGQLLVNYTGHGSEEQWSGDDLFDNSAATSLTNGSSLPVFLIMDCLNGLFQDVYEQPLAVTLMLAPSGGAVAVLASSGLNQPAPQTNLDKLIVQNALSPSYPALGDAILKAKAGISNVGVRKTYVLFGDPAMRIKPPGRNAAH